ncbi:MAG: hypothetical protein C0506_07475 [Anaerolinea sp.]|nr:hypothetical protein [Anaerolinea sp.]
MRAWLRTGRGKTLFAAALVITLAAASVVAGIALGPDDSPPAAGGASPATAAPSPPSTATAVPTATATATHFGLLDGVAMSEAEWAKRKDQLPLAVMFDNAAQAFPHDGLQRADLIYEAFVEGGITRLMAVYWRQDAGFLAPVRSARTPFVIWADELDALYAHGGSASTRNEADSAGQILEWKIKDLDAFGPIASQYYRDPDRRAPHDLATSTEMLRAGAATLGFAGPAKVEPWLFRDATAPAPAGEPAKGIEIDFGGTQRAQWQTVQYRWDEAGQSYGRFQYSGPHVDARTKEQLTFTTVIAMRALYQVVDGAGHVIFDQLGTGPATVFTDGKAIQATWKKPERKARTRFYDASGAEIRFARGPIFVEVLGAASALTVKAEASELPALPDYVPPPPPPPEPEETPTPAPPASSPTARPAATPTAGASATQAPGASVTPSPGVTPSASPTAATQAPGASPSRPASPTASATTTP